MELPGLAKSKCKALRRIASHPYSSPAERSEAKTPGTGFPSPGGDQDAPERLTLAFSTANVVIT